MWTLIGSAAAVTIALTLLLPGLHRQQVPAAGRGPADSD